MYNITLSDDNFTVTQTVSDPTPMGASNGSITESTGNTNAYFSWEPADVGTVVYSNKSSTLSNAPSGFYNCTVTSEFGCKITKNLFLGASALPSWALTGNTGTDPATNFIGTRDDKDLVVKTNNTEQMRIKANGNVGIGTSEPTEKLHVKDGSIYIEGEGQGLIVNEGNKKRVGFMKYYGREAGIWRVWDQDFEIGRVHTTKLPNGDGATDITNPAHFTTDIYVAADGNVGIGTTSSSAFVGFDGVTIYKLAVNGNIRAKKVVVETGWSDFVFNDNYKLKSLADLEKYIKVNKHLPEIPSAKEVEENGADIGMMQSKLLQKVEELTLYMIELKKENEEMKAKIQILEKK